MLDAPVASRTFALFSELRAVSKAKVGHQMLLLENAFFASILSSHEANICNSQKRSCTVPTAQLQLLWHDYSHSVCRLTSCARLHLYVRKAKTMTQRNTAPALSMLGQWCNRCGSSSGTVCKKE